MQAGDLNLHSWIIWNQHHVECCCFEICSFNNVFNSASYNGWQACLHIMNIMYIYHHLSEISSSHGGEYDVHSCLLGSLVMEAVRTSETSVDNHFTRQYIPEDNSEHHHHLTFREVGHCWPVLVSFIQELL
jgi:hypothetical protein